MAEPETDELLRETHWERVEGVMCEDAALLLEVDGDVTSVAHMVKMQISIFCFMDIE